MVITVHPGKRPPARGMKVTHADRHDIGTVVAAPGPAWTPDELSVEPPASGMCKVQWSDSADPSQLYWEYVDELHQVNG